MSRLLFLVSAIALASALPGFWRAFSMSSANGWPEFGDGLLFWLTWASDPGGRRLMLAAGLAVGLVALAVLANSSRAWPKPLIGLQGFLAKTTTLGIDLVGHPVVVAVAVLLAAVPHAVAPMKRPDASGKPDVLFILLDTVRLDHMGWGGCELDTTPKLDALARQGAAFTQTITQAPWTKPSVGTLMTGMVPGVHGAAGRRAPLPYTNRTLAEALSSAGYRTAALSSNPNITPLFGFEQGFQDFYVDTTEIAEKLSKAGGDWLAKGGEQPSFLYLHLNDAHYPYDPLPGYKGMFNQTGIEAHLDGLTEDAFRKGEGPGFTPEEVESLRLSFAEEIRYLDDVVGDFVAAQLAANDNLLVVICSDHGEEFLEHGDLGHAHSLHEELIRVPLQFAWSPALGEKLGLKAGLHDDQVRHLDVLPTLLELTGLLEAWPQDLHTIQGETLTPFLRLEGDQPERLAFSETDHLGSPLSGPAGPLRALRTSKNKLVITDPWHKETAGRMWLYDLVADPGEHKNLVLEEDALRESMIERMVALMDLGWLVERTHVADVSASEEEKANLEAMGYAEGGAVDFGAEPEFAPGAIPFGEIESDLIKVKD
ncbi:MAG: sulfatase [Planctomycetota bacterium]